MPDLEWMPQTIIPRPLSLTERRWKLTLADGREFTLEEVRNWPGSANTWTIYRESAFMGSFLTREQAEAYVRSRMDV